MNYKPMEGFVIVEPIVEKKNIGIIIPDSAVDHGDGKTVRGKVVAMNNGRLTIDGTRVKPELKVGDVILYSRYSPIELNSEAQGLNGSGKVYAVREDSIIAIETVIEV